MSTLRKISLPVIGKKMRLSMPLNITVANTLSASQPLINAGLLKNKDLKIPATTEIRIDAFKAEASASGYPKAKVSFFPPGGKMGTCYIALDSLEDVEWELVMDVEKKPDIPNKVTISLHSEHHWDSSKKLHEENSISGGEYFGRGDYNLKKKEKVIINPLSLKPDEMKAMMFRIKKVWTAFDINGRIDDKKSYYNCLIHINYDFGLELKPGFMEATLARKEYRIIISKQYSGNSPVWEKIYTEEEWAELDQQKIKKIVSEEMKKYLNWRLKIFKEEIKKYLKWI